VNIFKGSFNKEVLESDQPVIVKFCSDWSGSCHIMGLILKRISAVYKKHIKFYCLDIDQNKALKESFGIKVVPTIIIFNKGEIIDVILGITSEKEIESRIIKITGLCDI